MRKHHSVIVYSDVHVPYHDRGAYRLFRKMAIDVQPAASRVILLGDFLDNYAVSRYEKDPKREAQFQSEVDAARKELVIDREHFQNLQFDFVGGNHERRLGRYTREKAKALNDLRALKINELLGLASLDIDYHEQPIRLGNMDFLHGDEENAGMVHPARTMYLKRQGSFMMGHVHRADRFFNRLADGTFHQAYSNPCLCSFSQQEYVRGIPQWQEGFSKVVFFGNELLGVEQFIFNRRGSHLYATMDGSLYRERADGPVAYWSRRLPLRMSSAA